ncbi:MAG: SulP family inorganic anion transporter [Clostridia bacterium]|nr:SulP family inorganic anion transporter [Clostridia bacterium]
MKLLNSYVQMFKREFEGYNLQSLFRDLLAGLTVTAVALPLALAFGVSCGASAAAGLVTAIIAGIVISLFSGASFQISGPTGAMSAVLVTIIMKFKLEGVFVVTFMAGILLLLAAVFKLGRLVSMIPRPVITGFTSGIAIIIALGQIDNFFGTTSVGENAISKLLSYGELGFKPNLFSVLLGLIVVAVMIVWPKKWNAKVPSSLIGIIVATIVCVIFDLDVPTVGQIPKTLFLEDRLTLASVEWSRLGEYISPAISIAALAMIESLLCGASASRMKNEEFDANKELIAQGIGNMLIPLFGGVPATAAIARTSVAIKSGCQTRLCGIFHAFGLLAAMFALGPIMAKLPLSALAGVLMVTAWRMNEWDEIKYIFSHKLYGAIGKFLITMASTVVFDLTVAIVIGIVYSVFVFIYRCYKLDFEVNETDNETLITPCGSIFFLNCGKLESTVEKYISAYKTLTIDLKLVNVIDTSSCEYLLELTETNACVVITGAEGSVQKMLEQTGVVCGGTLEEETKTVTI